MNLVIVESPSKARTIGKYLGKDYKVIATAGHVRDLPVNNLGVDVNRDFEPLYVVTEGKEALIKELKKEVAKADKVYLATDPDREGEAISWHINYLLGLKDKKIRIEFNEITQKAIQKAISEPRELNSDLIDAQQTRRILDRLVGYKISPFISKKIRPHLSAGRVQSVALKIVYLRELEIRNFKSEEYWNIFAYIEKALGDKGIYKAAFNDLDGKKFKVSDKSAADMIIEGTKKSKIHVDSVKRQEYISKANAPFTTSTMQQDAVHKLGFTAPKVTQVAQKLYEGLDIQGMGHVALVTYIRTDSTRISEDAQRAARSFISANFGPEYCPKYPNKYETKKGAQDAHEAIRPVNVNITPEQIKDNIDKDSYRLYKLIYERFLASQMSPAVYDTLNVHIVCDDNVHKYGYQLKGRTLKFKGYTVVYNQSQMETNEDKEEEIGVLPDFKEGESLALNKVVGEQKFTKPPLRYTDASLIKALEDSGIGRPSTYSSIMQTLSKRDYTVKEKKYIVITSLGEIVVQELDKYFKDIMDIKFTSKMEETLDKIADGLVEWKVVLRDFYPNFEKELKNAVTDPTRVKIKPEDTDIKCTVCGSIMQVKDGKYGKFLGCSNYPTCNNIMNYGEIVSTCPKCHLPIIKKFTKAKKPYFICIDKKCGFISWDMPADKFCPICNSVMKKEKIDKKYKLTCTDKTCGHCEYIDQEEKKDNEA